MYRWEQDQHHKAYKEQLGYEKKQQPDAKNEPDTEAREAFEEAVHERSQSWKPTWQALGLNYDRTSLWKSGKEKEESKESSSSS